MRVRIVTEGGVAAARHAFPSAPAKARVRAND
jgi:hypothetical protein